MQTPPQYKSQSKTKLLFTHVQVENMQLKY